MEVQIIPGCQQDQPEILQLYRLVAAQGDGIIRNENEITEAYITDFIEKSLHKGLILLARKNAALIGEIHAYTPDIFAFRHMLSELTIVVHPEYQGLGIGRKLFTHFLDIVKIHYRHILRIELFVRAESHNTYNFYTSLGFVDEGRHENKILNPDLTLETPIHMAWFNPRFDPLTQLQNK